MASIAELYEAMINQNTPNTAMMRFGRPDYGYGIRYGSNMPKQRGYFGEISIDPRKFSTEISADDGLGEMPLLVPTLNRNELRALLSYDPSAPMAYKSAAPIGDEMMNDIYGKAYEHAAMRKMKGLDPFATINEGVYTLPNDRNLMGGIGSRSGAYSPSFAGRPMGLAGLLGK